MLSARTYVTLASGMTFTRNSRSPRRGPQPIGVEAAAAVSSGAGHSGRPSHHHRYNYETAQPVLQITVHRSTSGPLESTDRHDARLSWCHGSDWVPPIRSPIRRATSAFTCGNPVLRR
jgi:hypothetical protein